jgi:hypothetical protein
MRTLRLIETVRNCFSHRDFEVERGIQLLGFSRSCVLDPWMRPDRWLSLFSVRLSARSKLGLTSVFTTRI